MVELFTIISLVLIFVSLYFSMIFLLLYLKNKKYTYDEPPIPQKLPKVSVLIPAYNEEKTLASTLDSVVALHYSKNLLDIIVINDGSTDKTAEIAENYAQKYKYIRVLNKTNSGKADSLNKAIDIAKGEFFVVLDADSYIHPEAIYKSIGFFEDSIVGAVTFPMRPQNTNNFIEKFQYIEYTLSSLIRHFFQHANIIYTTHGVGCIFRKELIKKLGGFDTNIITEDFELTWKMYESNHIIKNVFSVVNSTKVPSTLKGLLKQRIRWMIGPLQTIFKYKTSFFKLQSNHLSKIIYPFTLIIYSSLFTGSFLLIYFFLTQIHSAIFSLYYQIATGSYPSFYFDFILSGLSALAIGLLIFSIAFIYLGFKEFHYNTKNYKIYFVLYVLILPFFSTLVLTASLYKILQKDFRWFK